MNPNNAADQSRFKRTKIVCTLGPSTDDESTLREMIEGGMNAARLNLTHDSAEVHFRRMEMVRKLSRNLDEFVAVMLDTRGPDVRTGELESDYVELTSGSDYVLTTEKIRGDENRVTVNFSGLPDLLEEGDSVFLDDGLIELEVEGKDNRDVRCHVVSGGKLRAHKGVNIPGKTFPLPVLTDQDIVDLREGAKRGIDYISASFVNTPEDVEKIRREVTGDGGRDVPVIAKIESAEGVRNLEKIIEAADGIMVARGDLGIEIPPEEVPGVQKRMIRLCREAGKPVITATEMLESMTHMPRPTRAEIADVANAVLDGTSAVMLSQETAIGDYPVRSVRMMTRICCRAEQDLRVGHSSDFQFRDQDSVRSGIAQAATSLARRIKASAIICVTDSGATAAIFSHIRPDQPVLACTADETVARMLSLYWGVLPVMVDDQQSAEALIERAVDLGRTRGFIRPGERIAFTGNVSGSTGETNLLAIQEV